MALSLAGELTAASRASAEPKTADQAPVSTAVDGVEVAVRDLTRSEPFFESLGFTLEGEDELRGAREEQCTGIPGARVRRVGRSSSARGIATRSAAPPP
ncbi:MAG TPA: hypothetical protein VHW01_13645 [Polyangiaceae bacterium]|nr:hypothetical protein [Polyangiaceae bacterium]